VKDCDLVPEECCGPDGGPKDQLTRLHVSLPVDAEFVFDGFAHSAQGGDILSQPVAQAVGLPQQFIVWLDVIRKHKEAGSASKYGSQHSAHRGHRANRPDLIEDKPHHNDREQYSYESIAGWGQLRRRARPLKGHQVEGKGKLEANVVEPRASSDVIESM